MNDGFRKALQEIADQDVTEIGLDPGWPRRVAKAALAALPDDIESLGRKLAKIPGMPELIESERANLHAANLEEARTKLIDTVQSAHRRSSREIIATLEHFIDEKISAAITPGLIGKLAWDYETRHD